MTTEPPAPTVTGWAEPTPAPHYVLRLFVAGSTKLSLRAVQNLNRLCARHLQGRYELEVVDIYQFPARAAPAQVVAAPTLLKELPLPPRRIIGDMADEASLLSALGLPPHTALN